MIYNIWKDITIYNGRRPDPDFYTQRSLARKGVGGLKKALLGCYIAAFLYFFLKKYEWTFLNASRQPSDYDYQGPSLSIKWFLHAEIFI